MDPKIWGPHLWFFMHILTFTYPEKPTYHDKRSYADLFANLPNVLPCEECKKHLKQHMTQYPISPHLDSKSNLIKWLIQIHNFANISLGKPTYTVEEVIEKYKKMDLRLPIDPVPPRRYLEKKYLRCRLIFFSLILLCIILYWNVYSPKRFEDIY